MVNCKKILFRIFLFVLINTPSFLNLWGNPLQSYDPDSIISVKNQEANRLYKDGFYYRSEEILKEVLELKKLHQPENLNSIANTYSNLGVINRRTFRKDIALNYYDKAEYIFQKDPESSDRLAALYFNKSSLYHGKEDYYKAERYLREVLSIMDTLKTIPDFLSPIVIYTLYSAIEFKKGNEEKALEYFTIAENKSRYDTPEEKLLLYHLIIYTLLYSENFEKYKNELFSYLQVFKTNIDKASDSQRLVEYYLYKGLYYYKLNPKNKITLESYLRALEVLRDEFPKSHPKYNLAYLYIIEYFFNKRNYLVTLDYVQDAFESLAEGFQSNGNYNNPIPEQFNDYAPVFNHLRYKILSFLHLYKEQNDINYLLKAKQNADYTLSLIEKLKWKYDHEDHKYYISETETDLFKIAEKINYDLYIKTGEEHYKNLAFELNERSKAFSLLINLRAEEAMEYGGIPKELTKQEADILQKISAFTEFVLEEENKNNPNTKKIKNWENALFNLNKEHEQLVEFFENNYPEYYKLKYDTRVMSSREVEKELRRNEVVIEYSLTDSTLFTYVISNSNTEIFEQKLDTSFRKLCLDFYNIITNQSFSYEANSTFRNYVETAHELYKILIEPVEEIIEDKNVILIPDGEISYVSFEALLTKPVYRREFNYYRLPYLVLDHGFSNSFSATVHFTESGSNGRTTRDILAFAPSYTNVNAQNIGFQLLRQSDREKLMRIPGVKEEVQKISNFMDADVYEDFAATESNFKKNAPNYKVLHLAMHTILDDKNPLYSKLAFTQMVDTTEDGFLHTFEIYNMQINADLAVLSSCNSGFGKLQEGEGIQSLARGFAYAGCPSILMTLWEVADESTVDIMERFYYYLDMGLSKNEALRMSKIDFLANADQLTSNPFFWSSFVLVGDTSSIYTPKEFVHLMNAGILLIPLPLLWLYFRKYRKDKRKQARKQARNQS